MALTLLPELGGFRLELPLTHALQHENAINRLAAETESSCDCLWSEPVPAGFENRPVAPNAVPDCGAHCGEHRLLSRTLFLWELRYPPAQCPRVGCIRKHSAAEVI